MQFAVWFPEKDSKQIKLDCRQTKPTVLLLIRVNQPVVCCIQQHQADVLALSIVKHHPKAFIYESLHCKMNFSYLIKHSLAAWRCSNPRFSTTPSSSHQQLAGSPPHRAPRVHWCFFSDLFFGTHPSAVIFLSLGPGVVPLLLSKLGLGGPGTWWCRMFGWFAACCNVWFMLNMLKQGSRSEGWKSAWTVTNRTRSKSHAR